MVVLLSRVRFRSRLCRGSLWLSPVRSNDRCSHINTYWLPIAVPVSKYHTHCVTIRKYHAHGVAIGNYDTLCVANSDRNQNSSSVQLKHTLPRLVLLLFWCTRPMPRWLLLPPKLD